MVGLITYAAMKATATLYRLLFRITAGAMDPKPDEVIYIESREPGRTIKVNVYKPAKPKTPSPVLVNWHGSGFMLRLHGSDDLYCRHIASNTEYTVLDCSYRLAPEYPFPASHEDAVDAVEWVRKRPNEYDLDNLSIGGFSAGGHIALSIAGNNVSQGTFKSILSVYPATDMADSPKNKTAPDTGGIQLPASTLNLFLWCLLQNNEDRTDTRLCPDRCDLEKFPKKMMFVTGAQDRLGPEAEALADRLKAVPGTTVLAHRMDGCHHAFDKSPKNDTHLKAREELHKMAVQILTEQ